MPLIICIDCKREEERKKPTKNNDGQFRCFLCAQKRRSKTHYYKNDPNNSPHKVAYRAKLENKHKAWIRSLNREYGITLEQYFLILNAQDGKCAICSTERCSSGRRLAVDHCHSTKKIRGLLCKKCNTALGLLQDNEELITKAAKYLRNSLNASS